jgi:tetratricopeptide (TPR) repeat protein
MKEAVHMYGGTVTRVLGDGIMALFGAPLFHEDHALRACYAALHMQDRVPQSAAKLDRPLDRSVQVHVGISSGEALFGTIASDLHVDYDAAGEIIHLAARLQQMATPGVTLCSGGTIRLAHGFVRTRPRGSTSIRGLTTPVEIFELLGAYPTRTRFHATAFRRNLSPFLGRDREYDTLCRCLELARQGRGQVVALSGDAGVGKSRLVWELVHSDWTKGWSILEAGAFSYTSGIPYFPVITLLKVYKKLKTVDVESEVFKHAIMSLLGIQVRARLWTHLDPSQRKSVIVKAVTQLICHQQHLRPSIIVVEDLHWTDNETLVLFDSIVDTLPRLPVLFLVNYRAGFKERWLGRSHVTIVNLRPLSRNNAAILVDTLLGSDKNIDTLKNQLIDRAEGNPFFLEESARAILESDMLQRYSRSSLRSRDLSKLRVSDSIQAILGSRIDQLVISDKRLLQAAAAIGTRFSLDILRSLMSERSEETLHAELYRLEAAGLIYECNLYPKLEYAFAHGLIQEVAYRSMLSDRRRTLHARIMQTIETTYPSGLFEQFENLASHAIRAGAWEKAALYARRAAEKAAAKSAYQEAVTYFEQALDALQRLPQKRSILEEVIDIRFALRNALFPLGMVERDLEHLVQSEGVAKELGDSRRLAWISAYVARDRSLLGEQEEALSAGQSALALAAQVDDPDLQVLVKAYIALTHYAMGNYHKSSALMTQLVSGIEQTSTHRQFGLPGPAAVFFRAWLTWALARLGDFSKGLTEARQLLNIATQSDQPLCITVAEYTRGFLYVHLAQFGSAVPVLERSLELCRTWGFPAWLTNIAASLGYAYAHSGCVDKGISLLEEAIDKTRSIGIMVSHSNEVTWLADAHLVAGRADQALALAEDAVCLARRYKERGNEADALCLRGEAALRQDHVDFSTTYECFSRALALAKGCGMKPTIVRCRLGLGELYGHFGEKEKSQNHFACAAKYSVQHDLSFLLRGIPHSHPEIYSIAQSS